MCFNLKRNDIFCKINLFENYCHFCIKILIKIIKWIDTFISFVSEYCQYFFFAFI